MSEKYPILNKKAVSITSLAMRFYKRDGWTLKLLESYLPQGEFTIKDFKCFGEEDSEYYILTPPCKFDVEKLYNDGHIGELIGRESWDELKGLSDLDVLKNRNWD
jgi:hypothetical protein